jgi:hypothetical protein
MATRFYFPWATAADVSPAITGSWTVSNTAVWRKLADTKGSSTIQFASAFTLGGDSVATSACERVYVSAPMAAGNVFTATTHTFSGELMTREWGITDNADRIYVLIKIVSEDGNTVRGTIVNFGTYGTTSEFSNNTIGSCRIIGYNDALTGSVTTQSGDRLVVEIGFYTASGTSPQANGKWGENGTDIAANTNSGTTNTCPWIEFSNTITMQVTTRTATRNIEYAIYEAPPRYYKTHRIVGSSTGAQTSYPVMVKVVQGTGDDSGNTVYLDDDGTKTPNFPNGIKFTNSDNTADLDFWLETDPNATTTRNFWVEIPNIPDGDDATNYVDIRVYYGSGASTASNGDNTFTFHDDFDSYTSGGGKWTTLAGTPTVSSGILTCNGASAACGTDTDATFGTGTAIRTRARFSVSNSHGLYIGYEDSATETYDIAYILSSYFSITNNAFFNAAGGSPTGADCGEIDTTNYHVVDLCRRSTGSDFYYEGVNKGLNVTGTYPTGSYPVKIKSNDTGSVLVDWVLVRKYVYPEPTHSTWGEEVDTEGPTTYTATRDIAYKIKTENRTATRDIGYAIPSGAETYTTTRDIAYKIESTYTTERDIQYRMAGESATTRKVTRSIHYHIAGQPSERFPDYTYTGTDVIVCIIDTGIDVAHPDLNDVEIVDWENYISGHDHLNDGSGHGTMVTSLLCGRARASPSGTRWNGIAPGVRLLFARVETDAGVIQSASVPTAFQWAVDNGAKIISWSSGEYAEHLPWKQAVEDARADGVLCVIAAGNANGQPDTTSEPAYRDAATAAGGLLENNTTIWGMSGRGPGENDITKPDLVWQAENVRAARPSNIQPPNSIIVDDYYCRGSGTSFSTPVIAGMAACIVQKARITCWSHELTPDEIENILKSTADNLGQSLPNNDYGWGRPNLTNALAKVPTTRTATKDIAYKIKKTNLTATRDIGYAIQAAAETKTTTRDILYRIKTLNKTTARDILYRIKTENRTATRDIDYAVKATTTAARDILYRVKTVDRTTARNILYRIKTVDKTATRNILYRIKTVDKTATRNILYRVKTENRTANRNIEYAIFGQGVTTYTATRDILYRIKTLNKTTARDILYRVKTLSQTATRDIDYAVKATTSAARDILYRVKTVDRTATRDIQYAIFGQGTTTHTATRDILYRVKTVDKTVARDILYRVKTLSKTTAKDILYRIKTPDKTATRDIQYNIAGQGTTTYTATRTIAYKIKATTSAARDILYRVKTVNQTAARNISYAIENTRTATRDIDYAVKATTAATRDILYAVKTTDHTTVRDILYRIETPNKTTARDIGYDIVREITRSLEYAVYNPNIYYETLIGESTITLLLTGDSTVTQTITGNSNITTTVSFTAPL